MRGSRHPIALDRPRLGLIASLTMPSARKQPAQPPRTFQLKVTLQDVRPPIWRRFTVGDDITLSKLHELLQIILGWTDSHLHQFVVGDVRFNRPEFELPPPRKDEGRTRLRDVLKQPKDRLVYEYDFGDGWEHLVVLEEVRAHEPRARYPVILGGARACPPDDCGGPAGYEHLLEVLAAPDHPEHDELREWAGKRFDPERFDVGALDRVFHGKGSPPDEGDPRPALHGARIRQPKPRPRVPKPR